VGGLQKVTDAVLIQYPSAQPHDGGGSHRRVVFTPHINVLQTCITTLCFHPCKKGVQPKDRYTCLQNTWCIKVYIYIYIYIYIYTIRSVYRISTCIYYIMKMFPCYWKGCICGDTWAWGDCWCGLAARSATTLGLLDGAWTGLWATERSTGD
jgi:hypothetical protein